MSIEYLAFKPILKYMSFRENLKIELSFSGMFVKELAAQAGLKKHTIDNYLSVRGRMPSAEAAVRIARVLGVSVEYLVTGRETIENKNSAHFSPEIRRMARIVEKLKSDNQKIVQLFVEALKKHEDSQLDT